MTMNLWQQSIVYSCHDFAAGERQRLFQPGIRLQHPVALLERHLLRPVLGQRKGRGRNAPAGGGLELHREGNEEAGRAALGGGRSQSW